MLIQCTKKLLDKMGVVPEDISPENPLFDWHANLIKIDRSNVVVLTNNLNRYTVVLWGLYAADFKKLGDKIKKVIRETFRAECIREEIIDEYLLAAGDIKYTKTAGPKHVAALNHICKEITWVSPEYIEEGYTNAAVGRDCSRMVKINGDYHDPVDVMLDELGNVFKKPVISCRAAKIKISLDLDDIEVSRTIVIPLEKTLGELHKAIQVVFSWQGYHLHQFVAYEDYKENSGDGFNYNYMHKDGWKPKQEIIMDEEGLMWRNKTFEMDNRIPSVLEAGLKLHDYLPGRMKYIYDFGDNWYHYIETLEIIEDYGKANPILTDWVGRSLPEDVGGPGGYERFLEALADEKHEEHDLLSRWGRSMGYGKYNPNAVNWKLERI